VQDLISLFILVTNAVAPVPHTPMSEPHVVPGVQLAQETGNRCVTRTKSCEVSPPRKINSQCFCNGERGVVR
jgi:hypothetical protein